MSILILGFVLTFVLPDKTISVLERRKLTTKSSLKQDFLANLDEYMSEQFPFRDTLLTFSAFTHRYILLDSEANEVYMNGEYIIEKNYPLNVQSIENFVKKINHIVDKVSKENRTLYAIIPDKSYYLKERESLKLDFLELEDQLQANLNAKYVRLLDSFALNDYFKTDIHLKQEAYFKIINALLEDLEIEPDKIEYNKNILNNFYGSSFSKAPFSKPEKLAYFTNEITQNSKVVHLEYGIKNVYDIHANKEIDMYNIFLSGPSAFIEIENEKALDDREIIIFRDSFASSLAPLLIPYYKKITLIDLRYISLENVEKRVDFQNKDILFLYSTLLVNNSSILKVNFSKD